MKKVFTVTIASCMLLLAVMNSCSKKEEAAKTTTPTPTPVTYPDDNTLLVDAIAVQDITTYCAMGQGNLYTMNAATTNQDYRVVITTKGIPSAAGDLAISQTQTNLDGTNAQVKLTWNLFDYVAESGTAKVVAASPLKVSFKDLKFIKTGKTDIKGSATLVCP